MRLTAKKAVEITRERWLDLAETGSDDKGDWPGWKKYGRMVYNCPLCEYENQRTQKGKRVCSACPFRDNWEGKTYCDDEGAPFSDWLDAQGLKERKAASQRMVKLCDQWLEDHAKPLRKEER